jgi:hypothetical protein
MNSPSSVALQAAVNKVDWLQSIPSSTAYFSSLSLGHTGLTVSAEGTGKASDSEMRTAARTAMAKKVISPLTLNVMGRREREAPCQPFQSRRSLVEDPRQGWP